MKRVLFFLFALISLQSILQAEQLTAEQSLLRLSQSSRSRHIQGLRASDLTLAYTSSSVRGNHFYAFNRTNGLGFVLLGADDLVPAVLAYSDCGTLNPQTMPSNLKAWLADYDCVIEAALASQTPVRSSADNTDRAPISPLVSTTWGQGGSSSGPYSLYTPTINSRRTYTGCLATAMAQIMKYHEWPERGIGSNSYTTNTHNKYLSADFSATTYNWSAMQDHYGSTYEADGTRNYYNYTTASNQAVSTLMYHCGVATNMDYTPDGSGAYETDAAVAYIENFGYDIGVGIYDRDYYTDAQWEEMLYTELNHSRPVLYTGATTGLEGHAFVCDGYQDGRYHINWGWDGMSDGYYAVLGTDYLHPLQQGAGGSYTSDAFTTYNVVVAGIQRPVAGSHPCYKLQAMPYYINQQVDDGGLVGVSFDDMFYSMTPQSIEFAAGLRLENIRTGKSYYIWDQDYDYRLESVYYGYRAYLVLCEGVPDGEYRAYPCFYPYDLEQWVDMEIPVSYRSQIPVLTVGAGFQPGDVTGDGEINVGDLTTLVSFILNTSAEGVDRKAADLNSDGEVTVTDYTMLVNLILNGSLPQKTSVTAAPQSPTRELRIPPHSPQRVTLHH